MDEETRRKHAAIGKMLATNQLDYLEWLNITLSLFNLSISQFTKMCRAEKVTLAEIHNKEYMLEKFKIWEDMFAEEAIIDYNYIQALFNNREVLELSKYAVKHKLSIQNMIYNTTCVRQDPIFWTNVTDTMLGILYDKE